MLTARTPVKIHSEMLVDVTKVNSQITKVVKIRK